MMANHRKPSNKEHPRFSSGVATTWPEIAAGSSMGFGNRLELKRWRRQCRREKRLERVCTGFAGATALVVEQVAAA
jgi:hypothetical protein